jgi:hypothetical protein
MPTGRPPSFIDLCVGWALVGVFVAALSVATAVIASLAGAI